MYRQMAVYVSCLCLLFVDIGLCMYFCNLSKEVFTVIINKKKKNNEK